MKAGEIEAALAAISVAIDDRGPERFDRDRMQRIVDDALGEAARLSVDPGGGIHEQGGARIGAVRRSDDGGWIVERQNPSAHNSQAAIPTGPDD